jgi:hypothetical protein
MDLLQKLTALLIGAFLLYTAQRLYALWLKRKRENQARTYLEEKVNDFELVKIYEGKDEKGKPVNWYAFVNPLKLPAARAIAGEVAMKQAEMNVDRDTLLEFINSMKEAANTGQITTMFARLENLEQRVNFACEEETLLSLACVYFLIEGEDPRVIAEGTQKRKREMMKADEQAKAFFLTSAFRLTGAFSDISESDILNYLTEVRQSLKAGFARKRGSKGTFLAKSQPSSTPSTNKTGASAGRALPKKKN